MYEALGEYYKENGLFGVQHSRIARYEILSRFIAGYTGNGRADVYKRQLYLRLLLVTDYVCGMTDSYAKRLYQEMNGMI